MLAVVEPSLVVGSFMLRFEVLNTAVWIIVKSMKDSILAMVGLALVESSDN